jgi:hypothetical protein
MYDWLLIGFAVLVVVGVSVYRHYKGNEEGCYGCCDDGDDDTLNVRPEIIEMCKEKYWEYNNGKFFFAKNDYVFYVILTPNGFIVNENIRVFATGDEIKYISNAIGNISKNIMFKRMVELLDVDKDAQIN